MIALTNIPLFEQEMNNPEGVQEVKGELYLSIKSMC